MPLATDRRNGTVRLGIFIARGFPLAPFSMVLETLRLANETLGNERFQWTIISRDGEDRVSSCGLPARVDHSVEDSPSVDVLLVCTGERSPMIDDPAVLRWLRSAYRDGSKVGAISGGAFVLARAGLLSGRTCAIHWASRLALAEAYPDVAVSGEIFVTDGRMITCAGGISTLDLMLHLVERFEGRATARRVADDLIYPSIRRGSEPARIELHRRTGSTNTVLLNAIEIMERNVEYPVTLARISETVGTSIRHLERLFARSMGIPPSKYYMHLRLREARGLLMQTDIPLSEVALRCGFNNTSHFARRYREVYAILPSDERRAMS
ncbi:MAG: GlxA family transcriptional regulator [Pseudomonadota bacterium]